MSPQNPPAPPWPTAIPAPFDPKALKEDTAWPGHGPDFFFALESNSKPQLLIDGAPGPQLLSLANSDLWYAAARIELVGKLHSFYYLIDESKFGAKLDVPAFGPLSYLQPGVPSGT